MFIEKPWLQFFFFLAFVHWTYWKLELHISNDPRITTIPVVRTHQVYNMCFFFPGSFPLLMIISASLSCLCANFFFLLQLTFDNLENHELCSDEVCSKSHTLKLYISSLCSFFVDYP